MKNEWEKLCEKFLFRFGRHVLGKDTGGLIVKLKQKLGIDAAWNALWDAQGLDDPREYVGAILSKRQKEQGPALSEDEIDRLFAQYQAKQARDG